MSTHKKKIISVLSQAILLKSIRKIVMWLVNKIKPKSIRVVKVQFYVIQKRTKQNLQILSYHRVNDKGDHFFPAIKKSTFRQQMEYLAENYRVISLVDAVDALKRNAVSNNSVVITFDDGYEDVYSNAFPVLRELSITATVFLSTNFIGSSEIIWHERVFSAFRITDEISLFWPYCEPTTYILVTTHERIYAQENVLKSLRSVDDEERIMRICELEKRLSVENKNFMKNEMLTWEKVKEMKKIGISFGSHTKSHTILSRIPKEKVREEIYESKLVIENALGCEVSTFAYPNGKKNDFNDETKAVLKEAGFICALTTMFGTNENGQDFFELRRGGPIEYDLPVFATKINWYKFNS
jgi:peptidoglycan/xylan/chitin deacetylase (PgdA/CDA1 family)